MENVSTIKSWSGITMGDDHNSRINKLAEFKQQLETEVKRIQGALDVCSVMDGAGFEEHFGYAPNSLNIFLSMQG